MRAVAANSTDPGVLAGLAENALREGEEEQALPLIGRALEQRPIAQLWQWKGLLERALDEHESALASFETAARLDPANASIAHGRARIALEAGVPAEQLYEHARELAPADGSVLIGLAAAQLAAAQGEQAEAALDAALLRSPLWIEGHKQLAQLRSLLGKPERALSSINRALEDMPDQPLLWQAIFDLLVKSEEFGELERAVTVARRTKADPRLLEAYDAIAAVELGHVERADNLFASLGKAGKSLAVWQIRHLLRTGRLEHAMPLVDRELSGPRAPIVWPYAAIAWRITGDQRWSWLEAGGKLVAVFDLADRLPAFDRLAGLLRSIHMARGEYLDQSLRGGIQTDGPLFSRIEPEIRALRSEVVDAVEQYKAGLSAIDPGHPLLGHRRDRRVRFAGSWSVWLGQQGFHVSHVHPQGWISSALYVAVPTELDAEKKEGWLQIGEPRQELGTGLGAVAHIEPRPGRLVLFPSWMWHGTIAFPAGERMSVAFDVAPPK